MHSAPPLRASLKGRTMTGGTQPTTTGMKTRSGYEFLAK